MPSHTPATYITNVCNIFADRPVMRDRNDWTITILYYKKQIVDSFPLALYV